MLYQTNEPKIETMPFRYYYLLVWSYTWKLPHQAILIDVRRLITIKV